MRPIVSIQPTNHISSNGNNWLIVSMEETLVLRHRLRCHLPPAHHRVHLHHLLPAHHRVHLHPPRRHQGRHWRKIPSSDRINHYGAQLPTGKNGEPMPIHSPTSPSSSRQARSLAVERTRPPTRPCWDQMQL